MAQKSLYKLLSSLSKSEFLRFNELVNSPFFNKRNDIIRFTGFLGQFHPVYNKESVRDEAVYNAVYGGGKFNRQVIKNLLNRTLTMCEELLAQLNLEKDKLIKKTALVKALHEKKHIRDAEKLVDESLKFIDDNENYTLEYLKKEYDLFELSHTLTDDADSRKKIESNNKRFASGLKFYLISLMRIASDYEVHSFVEAPEKENDYIKQLMNYVDIEKALELINEIEPSHYPAAACYYYGLMSKVNDPNGLNRKKLMETALANTAAFRKTDNIEFWQMIFASYIFSRSAKGPVNVMELHAINKQYIEKGIMYRDRSGYIAQNSYHNIAMQSIAAGDFAWTESFLNSFRDELDPSIRENVYNFLMGYYLLNKGAYKNVLPYLGKLKNTDIPTNLTARWMYIRCYYELGYFFEAESAIDAFKKFISVSGRVTKESRSSYPLTLRFIDHIVKSRISGSPLKDEIYLKAVNTHSFIGRKWILEKMIELRK